MTLPRLRVRELMFLVVYAALIGQAFVLSTVRTTYQVTSSYRSLFPGYAWVRASEIPFHVRGPSGWYWYRPGDLVVGSEWRSKVPYKDYSPEQRAALADHYHILETELADVLEVLTPEDLIAVTQENQK